MMLVRRRAEDHSIRCSPASSSIHRIPGNEKLGPTSPDLASDVRGIDGAMRCDIGNVPNVYQLIPTENELAEPTLKRSFLLRLCWPG